MTLLLARNPGQKATGHKATGQKATWI